MGQAQNGCEHSNDCCSSAEIDVHLTDHGKRCDDEVVARYSREHFNLPCHVKPVAPTSERPSDVVYGDAAMYQGDVPVLARNEETMACFQSEPDKLSSSLDSSLMQFDQVYAELDVRSRLDNEKRIGEANVAGIEDSSASGADEQCGMAPSSDDPLVIQPRRLSACSRQSFPTGKPFPKRPMLCRLGKPTWDKLEDLFHKMDGDGSNVVTRDKANEFFKGSFGKLSCDAMFNEVDADGSGGITAEEFTQFWLQVRNSGYSDQDILDELNELLEGGAWVDWNDSRNTDSTCARFPKRPLFCNLSAKLWKRCEELFRKIASDGPLVITAEHAHAFFRGSFASISTEAMFNEIDVNNHGVITADQFMAFWKQVKSSGYKESTILEEIELLMDGGAWCDWRDGRCTT